MTSSDAEAFPLASDGFAEIADLACHRVVDGAARRLEILGNRVTDFGDGDAVADRIALIRRPAHAAIAKSPRFFHTAPRESLESRDGPAPARALTRD